MALNSRPHVKSALLIWGRTGRVKWPTGFPDEIIFSKYIIYNCIVFTFEFHMELYSNVSNLKKIIQSGNTAGKKLLLQWPTTRGPEADQPCYYIF